MAHGQALPPIMVTTTDFDRLRGLAESGMKRTPQAAEFLAREIDRARIVEPGQIGHDTVTMGARVTFRDDVTGQSRTVTLVYPEDAEIAAGKISVLTPIGAALIGLSVGQSIEWQSPSGGWRSLTVLQVGDQWVKGGD